MSEEQRARRTKLIFVICALQADKHAEMLRKHFHRVKAGSALEGALWAGHSALMSEAEESVQQALQRGQLLLCWRGTSATAGLEHP